jgi:hypothetical protein
VSDEDDVDDLLNELKSDDDESADAERYDSDDDSETDDSDLETSSNDFDAQENMMSDDDDSMSDDGGSITQAEVYDNLKRIGELEDEKQKIQDELRDRTEQLRSMLKHVDRNSILYKMLQSALADSSAKAAAAKLVKKAAAKGAPKATAKKAPKKKARRKK